MPLRTITIRAPEDESPESRCSYVKHELSYILYDIGYNDYKSRYTLLQKDKLIGTRLIILIGPDVIHRHQTHIYKMLKDAYEHIPGFTWEIYNAYAVPKPRPIWR